MSRLTAGGWLPSAREAAQRPFRALPDASLRLANLALADGSAVEGAGSILSEGALVLDTVSRPRQSGQPASIRAAVQSPNLGGTLTIFGSQLLANAGIALYRRRALASREASL